MKNVLRLAPSIAATVLGSSGLVVAQDAAPPPNFAEHVEPILDEYCVDCHRGSRARNGLELTSVPKILAGGSSGVSVTPGDPDGSLLVKVIEHTQGPFMPPDDDKIPEAERAVIRAWIAGGARVDANDKGAGPAEPEAVQLPVATGGAAVMPAADLSTSPFTWTGRGGAVTALAVSPGAPLVAVGGLGQVSLYALPGGDRAAGELLAVLPFPEGRPERLSFASSGGVLLVAGGRPGELGVAAGYDVATGKRLFTAGDEPETVLGADLTGDLSVVILGGPDRVLRAFDPSTAAIRWESKVHTDWVTAVSVSHDSALVASADRAGGLVVHEAFTGREFYRPDPSPGAVTSIAWRADGARFAVTDESGVVRVFDPEAGKQVARWSAHKTRDGGALGVAWRGAELVTVGRDGLVRPAEASGRVKGKTSKLGGPALSVGTSGDGKWIAVGDLEGHVHVMPHDPGSDGEGTRLRLAAYPAPAALTAVQREEAQLRALEDALEDSRSALEEAGAALAASVEAEGAARARVDASATASALAQKRVAAHASLRDAAESSVDALTAARDAAAELARELGDPEAVKATLERWDALLAAARAAAAEAVTALDAARAEVEVAAAEIAAAETALEQATASRDASDENRARRESSQDEALGAVDACRARVAELRRAWEEQLSPGGTWRATREG